MMADVRNQGSVGYGVLDANTGQLVTSDAVLKAWLGERSLGSLLPDMSTLPHAQEFSERTRICPRIGEPRFATIEVTPLSGENHNWRLLRIQLSPAPALGGEYRDVVTDLPDRRALQLHRAQWQRESVNGQVPHALLFMDLDNFKQVNDSLGHAIGDKVLAVLAERWRKSLRVRDVIVRYGGDEFVVLLAGVRSLQEAQPIVDRLARVTSELIQIENNMIEVSVAMGVALAEKLETPLEELLAAADKAMYAAKRRSP
jgi:diguanylate cyclase (GGDEF)-like protein